MCGPRAYNAAVTECDRATCNIRRGRLLASANREHLQEFVMKQPDESFVAVTKLPEFPQSLSSSPNQDSPR
jgi:hypothetical protein